MPTLTETTHPGGFLVWEAFRDYTREVVTIAAGDRPWYRAGKITASANTPPTTPAPRRHRPRSPCLGQGRCHWWRC